MTSEVDNQLLDSELTNSKTIRDGKTAIGWLDGIRM